jgi:hypothetical protein
MPRPFPQANLVLFPPEGMDNCDALATYQDERGFILSHWQMSADELAEVNRNGGRVWVYVWSGETSPPIAVVVSEPFA